MGNCQKWHKSTDLGYVFLARRANLRARDSIRTRRQPRYRVQDISLAGGGSAQHTTTTSSRWIAITAPSDREDQRWAARSPGTTNSSSRRPPIPGRSAANTAPTDYRSGPYTQELSTARASAANTSHALILCGRLPFGAVMTTVGIHSYPQGQPSSAASHRASSGASCHHQPSPMFPSGPRCRSYWSMTTVSPRSCRAS